MQANCPRVLAAVDLGLGSRRLVNRAADIARSRSAKLTLLHVLDYSPPTGSDFPLISPVHERMTLVKAAEARLQALAAAAGAHDADVRVVLGLPGIEVPRVAEEIGARLVVVSGWRSRLAALLGLGAACLSRPGRRWDVVRV